MKKDVKKEKAPAQNPRKKALLTAAITGVVVAGAGAAGFVSNGKLFKQTQTNLSGKDAVQKTVVLTSRPVYENYHLSYDERKTALDKAVERGDLTIQNKDIEDGILSRHYVDSNGRTVAEESLEKFSSAAWQPFSLVFITPDVTPEYPIFQNDQTVQVQGNGTVERRDCFNLVEDENGDMNFVRTFSCQRNDDIEITTDYSDTGLPFGTTIETPTQKDVYFFPGSDEFQDDACHISTTLTEDGKRVIREIVYSATGEITYQKGKPIKLEENSNVSPSSQVLTSTSFER